MADEYLYSDLPTFVRKDSSGSYYEFGVILDGAFVSLSARKTGGIDDDIARAKAAAEEAKASKSSKAAA